jgi:uncharacterized membrane protein
LILAVYYGIALTAAGLQSGLALGLLIGVLAIIPILGSATGHSGARSRGVTVRQLDSNPGGDQDFRVQASWSRAIC